MYLVGISFPIRRLSRKERFVSWLPPREQDETATALRTEYRYAPSLGSSINAGENFDC